MTRSFRCPQTMKYNTIAIRSVEFETNKIKEGQTLNESGDVISKNPGYINYTIGQRKGIKISYKKPLYVLKIDAQNNEIVVGEKEYLSIKKIFLKDLNLLGSSEKINQNLFIKVRSTGRLIKANVNLSKDQVEVDLKENEMGISPGQACVFYSKNSIGDKILGGGWITKTINKYLST